MINYWPSICFFQTDTGTCSGSTTRSSPRSSRLPVRKFLIIKNIKLSDSALRRFRIMSRNAASADVVKFAKWKSISFRPFIKRRHKTIDRRAALREGGERLRVRLSRFAVFKSLSSDKSSFNNTFCLERGLSELRRHQKTRPRNCPRSTGEWEEKWNQGKVPDFFKSGSWATIFVSFLRRFGDYGKLGRYRWKHLLREELLCFNRIQWDPQKMLIIFVNS